MILPTFLHAWRQLSTKIVSLLLGFLALALMTIGVTLFLSWQLEGSSAAINETGSLRMQSYRLSMALANWVDTAPAQEEARIRVDRELRAVEAKFALIKKGDPQRPLFLPPEAEIHDKFEEVSRQWHQGLLPLVNTMLGQQGALRRASWEQYHPQVDGYVAQVDDLVNLIEKDSEKRTVWLRSSQLVLVAFALVGTVVVIYLMFLLIIQPVTRLHEGMRRMTQKDFSVRLPVESRDEFGRMSEGFNLMADRLEGLYNSLESRVQQKTAALADQNRELALLYDIAAFLQVPRPVEAICEGFLDRICQFFRADGGLVRVLEPLRGNLHMVVHKGISDAMVEAGHNLKLGSCLCGRAALQGTSAVHNLRAMDAIPPLLCQREGFCTVSLFPIYARDQQLGFFNLHFRQARSFSRHEGDLLATLGQLLGVAIENLRLAAREREMAISEERNMVAQGLHDSIAQGLTFLNIQVQLLEDSLHKGNFEEAVQIVPALQAGVKESYEDVRELLLNFRSRLVEGDLVRSLEATVGKFRDLTGITTEFLADVDGAPFPSEQQLQILFIVQEALSNIRKHAMANHVAISLADRQDFSLTIHDNGIGFDVETVKQKGASHVGLDIMRERAQRLHARFDIASRPGAGTTVVLHLPSNRRLAA
ncbi:MAG: type IV pili methyl-accepting chemotaxis transducer N-terminal domain-containing protein [Pollutimonas bauzanensis]|uniref:Sensor protein n=1 Tax=Pollutimonas bauzanensis TaxID=658167 RepID=A0A1M5W9Q1_9BURK|nr:type IV pili methyl-accepting chemotaxis transducer N-terminal domain-containing protein [Pollutimonas bauzanensis]SHH84168.1 two-component system, NarL family, nitrate/nitrite sensor histidine kinase NarX [Pollutimonas bauzanensis]